MGEIVVNDFLSFEGFVDSSYSHSDADIEGTKSPTTASVSTKLKSAGCSTSTLSLPKSILSMKMVMTTMKSLRAGLREPCT